MERHQVALYLGSMIVGVACAGLSGWSYASEQLVPYALGALLWTNFALMPLTGMSVGQYKRLACTVVLTATFGTPILVAPLVSLFIPEGGPVALAAVIVLLAPCVDYVVVFYTYCRRGISRFTSGNTLSAWRSTHFYSCLD